MPKIPIPIFFNKLTGPIKIYSEDGHILSSLGSHKFVRLQKISKEFIYAIIATEDHCFLDHFGINKFRILKAIFVTLFKKSEIQGASTITQQLSKNFFFDLKRTYLRKIRELLVSLQIEFQFSKKHILEAYLNHIFFGFDAYGVENASNLFFAKSSYLLSLSEAALLAGLPKSPKLYNPYRYPNKSKKRQMIVLKRMLKSKFVSKEEVNYAYKKKIKLRMFNLEIKNNSYFVDFIIRHLRQKYCYSLTYSGGLNVYTTVNFELQNLAESVLSEGLRSIDKKVGVLIRKNKSFTNYIDAQGAIISVDVNSGAVKAMVGGKNFYKTQFNRSIRNKRESYSNFRPFLYYSSFLHGRFGLNDVFFSEKIFLFDLEKENKSFTNLEDRCLKEVSLKFTFVNSVNIVTKKLLKIIGIMNVVRLAKILGFEYCLNPVYLFSPSISAFEISSAFSIFALSGFCKKLHYIRYIRGIDGKLIENHIGFLYNVLNSSLCLQLVKVMNDFVDYFFEQNTRYAKLKRTYIGFIGLSSWHNDAWITGVTPFLCLTVWVGYDKNCILDCETLKKGVNTATAVSIWSFFALKASKIYFSNEIFESLNFRVIESRKYKKTRFWTRSKKNFEVLINEEIRSYCKKTIRYFCRT